MRGRGAVCIALVLCPWLSGSAAAHDLQHEVEESPAVSVRLFFADGDEFSFEAYEIYRAGEEVPFQVGRTDTHGRLVFLPDRAGTWRVKVFSEDGHGGEFSVATGAEGGTPSADRPLFERYSRLIVGVSILFGLFGVVDLFVRRRLKL